MYPQQYQLQQQHKLHQEQAKEALAECKIIHNGDYTISVIGKLTIKFPFKYLPKIKTVTGDFHCSNNIYLKTLEGAPQNITGNCFCFSCNTLESLKGAPKTVGQNFYCSCCQMLKTLEGAPNKIGKSLFCHDCKTLTNIDDAPPLPDGDLYYENCKSLPQNANSNWLKKQEMFKNRIRLETTSTNQDKSTWKHTT